MKMSRLLLVGLGLSLSALTFSCSGSEDTFDEAKQFAEDLQAIDNYITENNITDTLHHWTKIRYKVHEEGTGSQARVGDPILVDYKGYLLDGVVFDSGRFGDNPKIILNSNSMINGWYYMCQEMQEGDSMTIFIPSRYGYGQTGSRGAIPPNTPLIFDMKMIRVGN